MLPKEETGQYLVMLRHSGGGSVMRGQLPAQLTHKASPRLIFFLAGHVIPQWVLNDCKKQHVCPCLNKVEDPI